MRGFIIGCIAFALPFAVQAQDASCMRYEDARTMLGRDYGETVAVSAVDGHGRVVIIFANPDTGTWSIGLALEGNGGSLFCPVAAGEAFTAYPPRDAAPNERGG
jgi:hypothetical protein